MCRQCLKETDNLLTISVFSSDIVYEDYFKNMFFFQVYPNCKDYGMSSNSSTAKVRTKFDFNGESEVRENVKGFIYLETRTKQVGPVFVLLCFVFLILRGKFCLLVPVLTMRYIQS